MKNKTLLITGGSQGIGKAIAQAFAQAGASVVIAARTPSDVTKAVQDIRTAGGDCEGCALDVRDTDAVQRMVAAVAAKQPSLDVLIACAGVYGPIGPFDNSDHDAWKQAIDINIMGTVNAAYAAVPVMKRQGHGTIITFAGAGVGGANIKPNMSAYVTSKFGICGFTEALANELTPHNIQVNAIAPGWINTKLHDAVLAAGEAAGKDFYEASKKQRATGGDSVEKVVDLVLFLSSEAGKHITGKLLSAKWDSQEKLTQESPPSFYTLRRIDDTRFYEKP